MTETVIDSVDATRPEPNVGFGVIITKIVWVIALLLIAAVFIFGEADLSAAASAPQQAAVAAMACFRLVAVYAFARGVSGLFR